MKAFKYVVLYLLIIQLALPFMIPLNSGYQFRMDYNLAKDNPGNIDIIMEQIKHQIEKENLQYYIIILGDSVAFSGPGPATQSIGYYLEKQSAGSNSIRVFNLAMPAMQTGDIYTMLLKLDQHNISTENVIFNVVYAGFVERQPGPPIVFWLKDDLRALDEESFNQVYPQLIANSYRIKKGLPVWVDENLVEKVALFKYRGFIKQGSKNIYSQFRYGRLPDGSLGDARPWFEKKGLAELLRQEEYQRGWSEKPFDMSSNNPQIFFLGKILKHQENTNTLIFLGAINDKLLYDKVTSPGYISNLSKIDDYFRNKPVTYLDLQGRIDQALFTDHVHLTGTGYRQMAQIIANKYEMGVKR